MSSRRSISNSFNVITIDDPVSVIAQYAPTDNPSSSQIHDTWQNGDLYMRTRSTDSNVWSDWHKIVGESGDETNYTFNISKEKTSSSATTAPSNCYYNTWQDAPIAPTSTYPYLWMKVVKKTWNESTQSYDSGTPSYARVTGEAGANAPYIELSRTTIIYRANNEGESTASQNFPITYALKVNGNTCTISSVNNITISLPTNVTVVSGTKTTSGCTINCTRSVVMSGVITITITGTYNGISYTATGSITVSDSREGPQGEQGKIGRFYYYGGEFDSSNTTKTFIVNDAETPYFSHGVNSVTGLPNCHVYSPSENPSSALTMAQMWANSSQSWNNAPWQTFTNDFQYLLARAVFANDAYLGSFIVTGDWFISQNGKVNHVASTAYTKFYPEFVNGGDLCENFDVDVNYVNVNSAYFIGGKTYYIKVSGSSFSSGCQLNVRMYNGSSNVGTTLNLTSSSPSGTITFEPTTSGTYYLRADCQSSGMTAKLTSYVECFVPNYAVDGLTGKTYQNDAYIKGEVHATSGEFDNGTFKNITATNINIKGSTRSPFTFVSDNGTFNDQFTDNMSVRSTTTSATTYYIPWDTSQSGKKITITNWKDWNGVESNSEGYAQISAPSGKYFFEDGIQKSKLRLSREAVELIGYGNDDVFFGWAVLKRIDLGTQNRYGHYMKMLAAGTVKVASTDDHTPRFVKKETFDGTTLSVSRLDVGIYKVTWNNNSWFSTSNDVFAMVCGYGTVDGVASNGPIYASVKESTTTSITVQVADDDSRNDGGFSFFLLNLGDWIYLHD